MALRRRPKPEEEDKWIQEANKPEESKAKGKTTEETEEEDIIQSLRLRIPNQLLDRIDRLVKKRLPRISRHTWILEALIEKAKREERKESK